MCTYEHDIYVQKLWHTCVHTLARAHTHTHTHTHTLAHTYTHNTHRSGSLPLWTLVIGLEAEVARFNSLPPCLFMTLGSILSLLAGGQGVRAVGLRELQRYDK